MIKNKLKWSTARNKPGWKIIPYTQLTTVVLHAKLAGKKPTIPLNRNSGWEMWVFQKRVSFFSSTLHHSFLFIEGPVPSCLWTNTHFLRNVHGKTISQIQACTFMLQSCTCPKILLGFCSGQPNTGKQVPEKWPRILRSMWFGFTL